MKVKKSTQYTSFKPIWWLRNHHLQTLWPALFRRSLEVTVRHERRELPDGDFLDLAWAGDETKPIVLILHGLGGSLDSTYVIRVMNAIVAQGWCALLMHFRGASGTPNRVDRSYHSGDTGDLAWLLAQIVQTTTQPVAVVGYSLGGNVLLKWLGEGVAIPKQVCAAVAVSVPFELAKVANKLQQRGSRFYQWYLLRKLKQDYQQKFHNRSAPIPITHVQQLKTFWQFDDEVTAPLNGFVDVHDYYHRSSSRQYLRHIDVPTLVIHAKDDPFMTPDVIPALTEVSPMVQLEISEKGGHVGFIGANKTGKAQFWLEQRIVEYIKHFFSP